jgi:hypothetical protein
VVSVSTNQTRLVLAVVVAGRLQQPNEPCSIRVHAFARGFDRTAPIRVPEVAFLAQRPRSHRCSIRPSPWHFCGPRGVGSRHLRSLYTVVIVRRAASGIRLCFDLDRASGVMTAMLFYPPVRRGTNRSMKHDAFLICELTASLLFLAGLLKYPQDTGSSQLLIIASAVLGVFGYFIYPGVPPATPPGSDAP